MEAAGRLAHTLFRPRVPSRYVHLALALNYAEPDGNPRPGRAKNEARFRTEPEARTDSTWLDTLEIRGASQYGILGLENVINIGRFQFCTECMNLWLDRDPARGDEIYLWGAYFYVAYFLTDHFQPWNRELGIIERIEPLTPAGKCAWTRCGAWQIAARWSFADLTDGNIQGGVGQSVTLALNWYWTPRTRLQFNALYGDISKHFPVDGETFGNYAIIGTRVMLDF